ncbi:hypothetical protein ACH5RR_038586 [Cinchona calisaya]|uniref:Cytochrome P450 n=1 Tax=Cinchona calisaya TaxID=153742 RepID=A0ABD2XX23_9GENT
MRKVFVREMLSGRNLDACYDLRRDEVKKAIEYINRLVGTAIDIGELTFLTEMNVIMSMLWGGTLEADQQNKVGAEFRKVFAKMLGLLSKPNISDIPILARFNIQGIEKQGKAPLQIVEEIFDAVINERVKIVEDEIKNAGKKKDSIHILLELEKQEVDGVKINMRQLKAIMMYIPFGSGRRVCAGIPLAERMVMYILASLLHSFDWKPTKAKDEDLSEKFGIVMRKATPFVAVPTKRLHD